MAAYIMACLYDYVFSMSEPEYAHHFYIPHRTRYLPRVEHEKH